MVDKATLRSQLRQRGRSLSSQDRETRSIPIRHALLALLTELNPQRIALYIPLPDEPDLTPLFPMLLDRSEVYLPRCVDTETMVMHRFLPGDELTPGALPMLREPKAHAPIVEPQWLDLIVVPAMAFDRDGFRLGRGRGFYDRYLRETRAYTVGVSLGLMEIDTLPRDEWDVPLDQILSPLTLPSRGVTSELFPPTNY